MYHVFYVNDGYMLALEISPVGYFRDLHHELTLKTGVLPGDQVFFLGSGEALIGDYPLSSYSDAGTESNPIYFVKRFSSEHDSINSREEEGINNLIKNWHRDVDQLYGQQIKQTLVYTYSETGEKGIRMGETLIRFCAKIVAEHQYLSHGWSAVIQNMSENMTQIGHRFTRAYRISQRLPQIRKHSQAWVNDFDPVFEALSQIKVPNYLLNKSPTGSQAESNINISDSISLYEWIDNHDPLYTLDTLIKHVSQHIEMLDDSAIKTAGDSLKFVKERSRRSEFRSIRGIDKRLAMLDTNLIELESNFNKLKEMTTKLLHPHSDQNNYRQVINEQRDRINEVSTTLEQFGKYAQLFLSSKMELLLNVRKRLAGWIRESYQQLQIAHTELTLFEGKFNGFRQRLDLVRQVREAPILYVAAVSEVIRRQAFRTEFDCWLMMFIQKCSEFIKSENTTRAEFYCKLEKHFLREIFKNMGDELPNFCPHKIKFDMNLPPVDAQLFRELREELRGRKDFEELFKVSTPDVFGRLYIEDPKSAQSPRSREHMSFLQREESFFVQDKDDHTIESKFPSTTWLNAVDEPSEMSPLTNQFYLSRAGGSNSSLNTDSNVTTPSDLLPNLESIKPLHRDSIPRNVGTPSSVDLTSPTSIHPDRHPTNVAARRSMPSPGRRPIFHAGGDSQVSLNMDEQEMSDSTTPLYNTPMLSPTTVSTNQLDEHTSRSQVCQESPIERKQTRDNYVLLQGRVAELSAELAALRLEFTKQSGDVQEQAESQFQSLVDKMKSVQEFAKEQQAACEKAAESLKAHETNHESTATQISELKAENEQLRETLKYEKYARDEKESLLHQKEEQLNKMNNDILKTIQAKDDIQVELLQAQTEKLQLETRVEAAANVDFLSIELDIVSQILKRELQPEEVDQVRAEIEKRKAVRRTDVEPLTVNETNLRVDYENAFRRKMTFVVQGIEEKKNEELAKMRDEIETESKAEYSRYIQKLKDRINEMEQKVQFYEGTSSALTTTSINFPTGINESFISTPIPESARFVDEETDEQIEEVTRPIDEPTVDGNDDKETPIPTNKSSEEEDADEDADDQTIAAVKSCTVSTQTKLRGRDLRMMITMYEISEGWGVILVFSKTHNSFCVFTMSTSLYFVKQRSLRKLGIDSNVAATKNTIVFARIANVELCETKKAPNRYNLPPSTRFYRVDVLPMPIAGFSVGTPAELRFVTATSASSSHTI
ncbi:RB1-inducible coiled-coil protein 1 [Aphelenchoides besseyi]|nr:RB1-inducible coiled-coil protein 1 [Aphelenchoides besseyi]